MRKSHVLVLAVLIAVGATLGTYALTRTTELGVKAREASTKDVDATIAARTHQLNTLEISLRKALAKKPPKLPALPPKVKAPLPQQAAPAPVYTRAPVTAATPAPVAVTRVATRTQVVSQVKQAPAHENEHSQSSEGGHDD